jgi:DNA adenine methylase
MNPPIIYFGGKQRIASRIIDLFPEHAHYVEPYAGGLSVLLAKPPSTMETINDLNGNVVAFWRVLRDRPDELQRVCELTPHSRQEFRRAVQVMRDPAADDLERARAVWVQLTQGRSGMTSKTGWRMYRNGESSGAGLARYLDGYRARLMPAAKRLRDCQIECRDALDVIADYGRVESTLLYLDPPYMTEARRSGAYDVEADRAHHEAMLDTILSCRARVALSGYATGLYDSVLSAWRRVEIQAWTTQSGGARSDRVEVLWMNYDPPATLTFAADGEVS